MRCKCDRRDVNTPTVVDFVRTTCTFVFGNLLKHLIPIAFLRHHTHLIYHAPNAAGVARRPENLAPLVFVLKRTCQYHLIARDGGGDMILRATAPR